MGETCEVVALGREDVCLEYKKVLTSYDELQLGKSKSALAETLEFTTDAAKKALLTSTLSLVTLVEQSKWAELAEAAQALDVSPLSTADEKAFKAVNADVASVVANAKRREASPIARAVIKLANDINACV